MVGVCGGEGVCACKNASTNLDTTELMVWEKCKKKKSVCFAILHKMASIIYIQMFVQCLKTRDFLVGQLQCT